MHRFLMVVSALLGLVPTAAAGAVELTLAAGARWGEVTYPTESTTPLIVCVTTPCVVADASTEEGGPHLSLILDLPVAGPWMIEGLVSRWEGDMDFRADFPGGIADRGTFESTTVLVGLLRQWEGSRWRPFATGALGMTAFESSVPAYDQPFFPGIVPRPVDEEVVAASLAGGVKTDLGRRLALRLEGRVYWHDLPDRLGGVRTQQEATVGLVYRW